MKPRLCEHCGKEFEPQKMGQRACRPVCALRLVRSQRVAEKKAETLRTRQRKAALKTIPELIREAQTEFNKWVRERDRQAGYPCISSGRPLDWEGNAVDAGHLRSTGAAPHLRFNEDNCHAQSKHDNRYLSGNAVEYRARLIERIGLERVQALEADNRVHKWTRDELESIKLHYRAELRKLKEKVE